MRAAITVSAALVAAAALWMARLMSDPSPLASDTAAVLGADLVLVAATSAAGMLLAASRLAKNLGLGLALAGLVLALWLEIDALWWLATPATGVALIGLVGPWTKSVVRRLPAADAPPSAAAALAVAYLLSPGWLALSAPSGLDGVRWLLIVIVTVVGGLYVKAAPWALAGVRIVAPLALAVAAAFVPGARATTMVSVAAAALAVLAWRSGARVAIRPLVRPGRAVPILPEMVPGEILDAAGLDDRGRRKEA